MHSRQEAVRCNEAWFSVQSTSQTVQNRETYPGGKCTPRVYLAPGAVVQRMACRTSCASGPWGNPSLTLWSMESSVWALALEVLLEEEWILFLADSVRNGF